ncbi:MAG: glycosyltransferase [Prevotella sp.]|nr:glycosyltransferase [Prevotella sp.]MDY6130233.1 glycosyltransferase [Prevotella sp.]
MLTVSIVTYKTDLTELEKCFTSLETPIVSTIYVVDNSNENYIKNFCSQYSNVEYIGKDNIGYGAGHNVGIRKSIQSGADFHLVLNSDVYFRPTDLEKIYSYMSSNKQVGQLIPNTIYPNGDMQYVVRLLPTPMIQIFRRFFPDIFFKKYNDKFLLKDWNHKSPLNIPFHIGCFMFFSNDALKEIGLFDEKIFMYMEDIDLTRRMHKKYETIYWPEVTIIHDHKRESYKNTKLLKIHVKSAITYFNKWGWFFDRERKVWNKEVLDKIKSM